MAIGKLPDGGGGEDDDGETIFAEINITPLTDVFLVMVIIFMVSALAVTVERNNERQQVRVAQDSDAEKRSGIKINLPSGKAMEIEQTKSSLVLEVPLQGDIVIGGKTISDGQLDSLFQAAFKRDTSTQVVLKADKGVAHGRVVNLLERAKQVGLTHIAIATAGG